MEIDIRPKLVEDITVIRFAPLVTNDARACDVVVKENGDCPVWIENSECSSETIGLRSEKDALNLIKALEKAIELKWFDK